MIFIIPGNPIPQKRHRHAKRGTYIHTYDPLSYEKHIVQIILKQILKEKKLETLEFQAIELKIEFHLRPPKKLRPIQNKEGIEAFKPHITKPDIDNLLKFLFDCGNGILWTDDSKITTISCKKSYSTEPLTKLEIIPI